ncbi:MAG: phosphate regulon sensor histidine kinase PhoR [Gammaproteobacteria bacterium]|nr:phosphate regulon sensor histidine kinase PhoR [Gammaproteobacteria bacterium]
MKQDIIRLAFVLSASLILGVLTGHIFLFLTIGLLIHSLWYLKYLNNLLLWIKQGKRLDPPEVPGLIDDITREFLNLKNRHKKRKKKLTTYLKRFKETTQALPDAIVVLGDNDVIEWSNDKARDYLGIIQSKDIGQRIGNLVRHPSLIEFLKQYHDSKDRSETSIELNSNINKNIYLEVRLVPFGKAGKLLVARDITSIYRINKMRTDFIANASHELRTPLTVISGYLESFEDDFSEEDQPGVGSRIKQMRTQTERMRRLIEDLLKLSVLETTDELLTCENVRVPDILRNITDEAKAVSKNQNQKFMLDVDENLWVGGDRNQIYSAFSNLVINAVQHTPVGGSIYVRWYENDDGGVLEVEDTGEGISPEHISRVTERFYRVDRGRSREKGGTGLGLAIVKHSLANHGAKLHVESEIGKGSQFKIIFPSDALIRKDIIVDRKAEA